MKSALFASLVFAVSLYADLPMPRITTPVTIDGDLSDEAWKQAVVLDKFYEYQRSENGPAPVPTTAYVMYDANNLYIGVDARDPEPARIRAPFVDRDRVFGDMDNIAVFIDARGEGKVALQLRTNPRGIQADAVNNDSSGSEDFSPDFFYDTVARITDTGWIAEFRIPLSTLRYTDADPQTWGIIVMRNWPRDFRYTMSTSPLPRGSNCFVCHAMKMTGLTGLPSSQHLIVAPYVAAQQSARPAAVGQPLENQSFDSDAGLDLKWSPTPDWTLDGTLNPDFSQIEADVAQIAANQRFALFYPEKRPFFLEGSDLLQTEIDAVYTRTITSPRWGARSTGKLAGTSYTLLVADDRGGGSLIIPGPLGSDFVRQPDDSLTAIGRARKEIGRSAVGMVFTARESDGDGGYNRVIGPDLEWRPNEKNAVRAQLLVSDTDDPYTNGTGHGFEVEWGHSTRAYDFEVGIEDFSDEFRADNGFVPQVGYRQFDGGGGYNFYPKESFWIQVRPNGGFSYVTDQHGQKLMQDPNVGLFLRGKRNLSVSLAAHAAQEVFTGRDLYRQTYLEYNVALNPSAKWPNFGVNGRIGQDIDYTGSRPANSIVANFSSTFRPLPKLQAEVNWGHEQLDTRDVEDSGRLYTAAVQRLKLTYSFTAKSLLRAIGQYVRTDFEPGRYDFPVPETDGNFLGSLLYSYKVNWQTVLFVGYGDDRILDERADLLRANRTFFVKLSYALQR
ncbi:MAG TPA: DUF5916 domain-containing protein [Thermoanaerobaculia bacterium]|jgi:hypothetical protein